MALNDRKIIVYSNPVASLPDHPSQGGWTAAALKAAFDANATNEIKTSINGIVDDLKSASGANEIGATPLKVGGASTVQGQLEEVYNEVSPIIPSEATRISSENTRISNENTRISNEDTRIENESARVTAENTRISNEDTRIENENLRQSTVAAIEANYAPRLTTAEQQINNLDAEVDLNTTKISDMQAYIGYTSSDIYGIEVDIPNNTIIRLAGAVGKTAGADFNNINAFKRRRCNLSDTGVINAYYGDVGYKDDGTNGQVMVEQPKFYYKRVPLQLEPIIGRVGFHLRKWRDYISDKPIKGFKLHPAFIVNGVEKEKIFLSAYEGSIFDVSAGVYLLADEQVADFNADKLSSRANAKPASGLTQLLTRANARKLANNRGVGWGQNNIFAESAEQLLASIEYATFDLSTAIGLGVVNKASGAVNESENTGATSSLGNTSGMATGTNGLVSVSYRGKENPWGNIWKWLDGINIEAKGIHYSYVANYGFVDDIKTAPYQNCGFTLAKSNGYVSAIGYSDFYDFGYLASETLGASNRPLNDYFYQNNAYDGFLVCRFSGNWNISLNAGMWCLAVSYASGGSDRMVGSALLYVPQ